MGLILASLVVPLAVRGDQPIVENYVGRQIPTAMVARNLDAGSGFLHPTLDTAPFPNRFLVEPPIYAQVVVWGRNLGRFVWEELCGRRDESGWEPAGRWTSAAMTTLGAWAFYGLVRRREGAGLALVALASFCIFPVTLRYGRAFQPDALMLGLILLGMRGWDEFEATGLRRWAWVGGVVMAAGLATKITAGWVLIPFLLVARRLARMPRVGVGLAMLTPALAWYLFAWNELSLQPAGGSLASADNAALWASAAAPAQWLRRATWDAIARNLLVRAFTPLGIALAASGWAMTRRRSGGIDRLWAGWGLGCVLAVFALASKWHHGYYWLVVAPPVAVGVAHGLAALARLGRPPVGMILAGGLGALLLASGMWQAAPTWRTPPEWSRLQDLPRDLPSPFPNWVVIAPEAVLYYLGRPGYRLEFAPAAVRRAAGEWGRSIPLEQARADPMALVDFSIARQEAGMTAGPGALPDQAAAAASTRILVVDVGPVASDPGRAAWRAALRAHPRARVWRDESDLIMVEVGDPPCRPSAPVVSADQPPDLRPISAAPSLTRP